MEQAAVFDDIYQDYVNQVAALDLSKIADRLGLQADGRTARIPLYGKWYEISPEGIADEQGNRPSHSISVVLCKYLLLCPSEDPAGDEWVTYRNFKNAAPYLIGFSNTVEKPIARLFSNRVNELQVTAEMLTGRPAQIGISCDLALEFSALPQMPVLLLFNDQDEDFPAECSLLLQQKAEKYLDMECLAIIGGVLATWLKKHDVSA